MDNTGDDNPVFSDSAVFDAEAPLADLRPAPEDAAAAGGIACRRRGRCQERRRRRPPTTT